MGRLFSDTDWSRQIDAYCERLGPGLWAEPVNFLTNGFFLLAAILMWQRSGVLAASGLVTGRVLAAILFVIGLGSGLFHSFATAWASTADVLPIALFVLAYIFVANRDYLGLGTLLAVPATIAAFALLYPLSAGISFVWDGAGANAAYGAVCLLILLYGLCLMPGSPRTGGRLVGGAILLALSITARSLDMRLCENWPLGTHFLWHTLNAVMLGWMIEVWLRDRSESAAQSR